MTMVSSSTPWKHQKTSGFWEAATAYLKFCKIYSKTPVPDSLLPKKETLAQMFFHEFWEISKKAFLARNFIKKRTLAQVFSCEFCEISKRTFFTEHVRATASSSFSYISREYIQWAIITCQHGIYELPHEPPNNLRLRKYQEIV